MWEQSLGRMAKCLDIEAHLKEKSEEQMWGMILYPPLAASNVYKIVLSKK